MDARVCGSRHSRDSGRMASDLERNRVGLLRHTFSPSAKQRGPTFMAKAGPRGGKRMCMHVIVARLQNPLDFSVRGQKR